MLEENYKFKFIAEFLNNKEKDIVVGKIDLNYKNLIHFEFKNAEALAKDMLAQVIVTSYQEIYINNNKEVKPPLYFAGVNTKEIFFVEYSDEIFNNSKSTWHQRASSLDEKTKDDIWQLIKNKVVAVDLTNVAEVKSKIKEIEKTGTLKQKLITKYNFSQCYFSWKEYIGNNITPKNKDISQDLPALFLSDIVRDNVLVIITDDIDFKNQLFNVKTTNDSIIFTSKEGTKQNKFYEIQKEHIDSYKSFWEYDYKRPPSPEDFKIIQENQHKFYPEEIRKREGREYTPLAYVSKSMDYLNKTLGDNWQEEYIVVDMCCGTGNLEHFLTNKEVCYLSTLGETDVNTCKNHNFPNVLEYNFLENNELPKFNGKNINEIAKELNKKILVLINPPYVEPTELGKGKNKEGTSQTGFKDTMEKEKWGASTRELFTQFLVKIHKTIPNCKVAVFSTMKYVNSSNFVKFRENFKANFLGGFLMPSKAFELKGDFPIGFLIWDLADKKDFPQKITLDIIDFYKNTKEKDITIFESGKKEYFSLGDRKYITSYPPRIKKNKNNDEESIYLSNPLKIKESNKTYYKNKNAIGFLSLSGNDFLHNQNVYLYADVAGCQDGGGGVSLVNIKESLIYLAIRRCMEVKHSWINHTDQFLKPNKELTDMFISNCIMYALFNQKNNTSQATLEYNSKIYNIKNYFFPFTPHELDIRPADFGELNKKILSNSQDELSL
ncbi:MAG: hypothetical protein LBH40_06120, partial [Alphaproteobacteria bacterium]|nr:hypothetical protein [Alphaproteobacteria bacterium]